MRFTHLPFLFPLFAITLSASGLVAQELKDSRVILNSLKGDEEKKVIPASGDAVLASKDEAYQLALKDFSAGKFEAAEEKFQLLAKRGLIAKELYLNLGTTLEKLDQPGKSALWMRRALLLDPGMVEPRQNMAFLKKKLGYLEFSEDGGSSIFRSLPPTIGDWIAMIGLWMVAICVAMAFLLPRYQERRFRPLFFGCLAAVFAFGGASFSHYYAKHFAIDNFATITVNGASALTSPVPDAKTVIDLPPGSEVRILQETGPWTYVEIPGDIRGWLRNEQLATVWPISMPE